MREMPTIKGRRPGIHTLPPIKEYVYRGDQPFVPPKSHPAALVCAAAGCAGGVHAKGLCSAHYRKAARDVPLDADNRRRGFTTEFCGTTRGYKRHRHYGVDMCQPCRDAKNAYDRARRARTGAKK